jgi:hypothetical protein
MGNLFQKHKIYEIDDGLLGVKRDIFLKIIRFLSLGDDRKVRNV